MKLPHFLPIIDLPDARPVGLSKGLEACHRHSGATDIERLQRVQIGFSQDLRPSIAQLWVVHDDQFLEFGGKRGLEDGSEGLWG